VSALNSVNPASHPDLQGQAQTLAALEWPRLLAALGQRLATPLGAAALERMPFHRRAKDAAEAMARVEEMTRLLGAQGGLPLAGEPAVEELALLAAKGGRLEGSDLLAVARAQRAAEDTARMLRRPERYPRLAALAEGVLPLPELRARLEQAITPRGALNESAFPELGKIARELAGKRDDIVKRLTGWIQSGRWGDALQEPLYTLRGNRHVVPVKADFKGRVGGIVHDVSSSGATLFVEPTELVEPGNELAMIQRRLAQETDRILRELSALVGEHAPALGANLGWLGQADLLQAQGRLAEAWGAVCPQVGDEGVMELKGVVHPLMALNTPPPVANDLSLGRNIRCLILSGANTGGKTVLLKTVGLCALLVAAGMPIPARAGSRFDLFPQVWADIGDRQDLAHALSTFSAQLGALGSLLGWAGPGTLVLLDEVLHGTDPDQGSALAQAVLEELARRGAVTLVTTHYGRLKGLAGEAAMGNASVAFDPATLAPTYRLIPGLPGGSQGFHTARRLGLGDALVARAEQLAAGEAAPLEPLMEKLRSLEHQLAQQEAALVQQREHHARQSEALTARENELALREAEVRRMERGRLSGALAQARERVARLETFLTGQETQAEALAQAQALAAAARQELRDTQAQATQALQDQSPELPAMDWNLARPGLAVYLPGLGQAGRLENIPDMTHPAGKRVSVRLGGLVLELPAEEITPLPKGMAQPPKAPDQRPPTGLAAGKPAKKPGGKSSPGASTSQPAPDQRLAPEIPPVMQRADNTVTLLGLRAEEALDAMNAFLDQAVRAGTGTVVIVHGFGTGALRNAVRKALKDNPYVAGFRPGGEGEGRDGVTVAALKD